MAITTVGTPTKAAAATVNNGSQLTVTFDAAPVEGQLLRVVIQVNNTTATIDSDSGYTLDASYALRAQTLLVWSKIAGASESQSPTWTNNTGAGRNLAWSAWRSTGHDPANRVVSTITTTDGGSLPLTSLAVSASGAASQGGQGLIVVGVRPADVATYAGFVSATNGFTLIDDNEAIVLVGDVTSGNTASSTVTWTDDGLAIAISMVYGGSTSTVVGGVGTGTITLQGSASGQREVQGLAVGQLQLSGSAIGVRETEGAAVGQIQLIGTASGAPVIVGTAEGTITLVGAAAGIRETETDASGIIELIGTVNGDVIPPNPVIERYFDRDYQRSLVEVAFRYRGQPRYKDGARPLRGRW